MVIDWYISLIPSDYLIAEDLPAAISEVTNFMMYLVSEGNIDPSTVAVQMDTEFNEIDIVGIQDRVITRAWLRSTTHSASRWRRLHPTATSTPSSHTPSLAWTSSP